MTRRPLTYVLATHAGGPVASCAGQTETDLSLRLIAAPNDSDPVCEFARLKLAQYPRDRSHALRGFGGP
jgi:hypothetical protein